MEVTTVPPHSGRRENPRRLARRLRLLSSAAGWLAWAVAAMGVLVGAAGFVRTGLDLVGGSQSVLPSHLPVTVFAARCGALMLIWFYAGYFVRALEQMHDTDAAGAGDTSN